MRSTTDALATSDLVLILVVATVIVAVTLLLWNGVE